MKALFSVTLLALLSLPVAAPVYAVSAPAVAAPDLDDTLDRRSGRCFKRAFREGSTCGGV